MPPAHTARCAQGRTCGSVQSFPGPLPLRLLRGDVYVQVVDGACSLRCSGSFFHDKLCSCACRTSVTARSRGEAYIQISSGLMAALVPSSRGPCLQDLYALLCQAAASRDAMGYFLRAEACHSACECISLEDVVTFRSGMPVVGRTCFNVQRASVYHCFSGRTR